MKKEGQTQRRARVTGTDIGVGPTATNGRLAERRSGGRSENRHRYGDEPAGHEVEARVSRQVSKGPNQRSRHTLKSEMAPNGKRDEQKQKKKRADQKEDGRVRGRDLATTRDQSR
jgi:hypothetical protein